LKLARDDFRLNRHFGRREAKRRARILTTAAALSGFRLSAPL
jgi:hypothetical protein